MCADSLVLLFNFGVSVQSVSLTSNRQHPVNDGAWHEVDITISPEAISLQLDLCRDSVITEHTASGRSEQDYMTCFASQYIKGYRLDLAAPLSLGGLAPGAFRPTALTSTRFEGKQGRL